MTIQAADGRVEFRLYRPEAGYAAVAGDFNSWNPRATPMHRQSSGHWTCSVELVPGCYQFRYLVDGAWLVDCASFGLQPGPYGWNSVVYVRPQLAA